MMIIDKHMGTSTRRSSIAGAGDAALTQLAFDNLINWLKVYGNEPSPAQKAALYEILNTYTMMAKGVISGRYAFPLPTGMGKTTSIKSWLLAIHRLERFKFRGSMPKQSGRAVQNEARPHRSWDTGEENRLAPLLQIRRKNSLRLYCAWKTDARWLRFTALYGRQCK